MPRLEQWGQRILQAIEQRDSHQASQHSTDQGYAARQKLSLFSVESRTPVTSIPSILNWKIFHAVTLSPRLKRGWIEDVSGRSNGKESASVSILNLKELSSYFVSHYLAVFPIVDPAYLKEAIFEVDENGIGWTVNTCFVLLVAALGDLCSDIGVPTSRLSHITRAGFRYWNMAKKRLSWALEEDSLQAAQCLCLSGWVVLLFWNSVADHITSLLLVAFVYIRH